MSYSYIKSVFPNFENSNKVYDENLYNNITSIYSNVELPQAENNERNKPNYKTNDIEENKIEENKIEKMSNVNINDYAEFTLKKPENQNNLSYYNIPLQSQLSQIKTHNNTQAQHIQKSQKKEVIENFENKDCDGYIKHVYECDYCKKIITKQLGIDNDRYRHEEMIEVASYIIFGLFILLLVDSLKSEKR